MGMDKVIEYKLKYEAEIRHIPNTFFVQLYYLKSNNNYHIL